MTSFIPTSQQAGDWQFFIGAMLGVVLVLLLTTWISEGGTDQIVAWWGWMRQQTYVIRFIWPFSGRWTIQPSNVVDFDERRKLRAITAMRGPR